MRPPKDSDATLRTATQGRPNAARGFLDPPRAAHFQDDHDDVDAFSLQTTVLIVVVMWIVAIGIAAYVWIR